mgnify:FL=1
MIKIQLYYTAEGRKSQMKIDMNLIEALIVYIEQYGEALKKIKEISENESNLSDEYKNETAINISKAGSAGIYLNILTGVFLRSYLTEEEIKGAYKLIMELSNNTCAEEERNK